MDKQKIKQWLDNIDNNELKMVYLDDGQESLINPNIGYALRDEIFKWQDHLDKIEFSSEGLAELYLLTEDILSTLETRMALNPDFIQEMEGLHKKVESGDTSDFVKVDLPQRTFFDLVNDYCDATKIGDVLTSCTLLINYVQERISDVDCDIYNGQLWIKRKNNKSLSTDLISQLLNLDIKNIDDSQSLNGIWSIHLYRR